LPLIFAEQLHHRLDHARVTRKLRERIAVQVRGEVRAHRVATLLANVFGALLGVKARHFLDKHPGLLPREPTGKEQVSVLLEAPNLLPTEFHLRDLLSEVLIRAN
jgi:hypothetical protein